MINKIIRNFLAKRMAGRSDDGIMITLKDPQKVIFAENILMDTLMRNGIDPRSITSEAQLKAILNQITKTRTIPADSPQGKGITEKLLGKRGEVVDMTGKKIPPGSRIMGGKEVPGTSDRDRVRKEMKEKYGFTDKRLDEIENTPIDEEMADRLIAETDIPPGSRGGADDIAAPIQSAEETIRNMVEAEATNPRFLDYTIDSIKKMEPIDAMKEANKVIKREGPYKNLSKSEAKKILDDTEDHIFQRDPKPSEFDPDPDEFATGGRVGLFMGSRPATQQGLAALREMLRFFSKGKNRTGSDILKMVNPKGLNKLLNDPAIYNKFSVKEGLAAPDMIKNMQNQMTGERKKVVSEILGAARNIQKADENTIKYKNEMIEEMVKKGADKETAKGLAQLMTTMAEDAAGKMPGAPKLTKEGVDQLELILKDMETGGKKGRDLNANGGRIGYKDGPKMTRRTFLKYLTGLAAIPIVGKIVKPLKTVKGVKTVPIIKTGDAVGKPEWFDQLVNKVIIEGDDVTKKFATKDREIVHMKKIDDETSVTVTRDLDDDSIIVDIDDPVRNVMGESGDTNLMMRYKKGRADEETKGTPPDEFDVTEADMRNYMEGPDDYVTEFTENTVQNTKDLTSDLTKVKSYATGKNPTMKELVESKRRRDEVRFAEEKPAEYASQRGPDVDFSDYDDYDYASGGLARMLGE